MVESATEALQRLRRCQKGDIVQLMRSVGLDPRHHFRGGTWRACDFTGLDLSGFNFRGADLRDARFEGATVADADFRGAQTTGASLGRAIGWRAARLDAQVYEQLVLHDWRARRPLPLGNWDSDPLGPDVHLDKYDYVALIHAARTFAEARRIVDHMNFRGVGPNLIALTTLMDKAPDPETAQAVFAEIESSGLQPDRKAFNALMSKMNSFEDAQSVSDRMKSRGFRLDLFGFNILISKSSDTALSLALVDEMMSQRVMPNPITFHPIISKAESFSEATQILFKMERYGVNPRISDYAALATHIRTSDERQAVLDMIATDHLSLDARTWNIIIGRCDDFSESLSMLAHMRLAGVARDKFTLFALLRQSRNFTEACNALVEIYEDGVRIDHRDTVKFLIKKTTDWTRSRDMVHNVLSQGGSVADQIRALVAAYAPASLKSFVLRRLFPPG